jgi:hypothetical protein
MREGLNLVQLLIDPMVVGFFTQGLMVQIISPVRSSCTASWTWKPSTVQIFSVDPMAAIAHVEPWSFSSGLGSYFSYSALALFFWTWKNFKCSKASTFVLLCQRTLQLESPPACIRTLLLLSFALESSRDSKTSAPMQSLCTQSVISSELLQYSYLKEINPSSFLLQMENLDALLAIPYSS